MKNIAKRLGKRLFVLALACLLACGAALADGENHAVYSRRFGHDVWLAAFAYPQEGYTEVDGFGGITSADPYYLTVISKSASVWAEPRTNSKKLASVSHGDLLMCRVKQYADGGESILEENGFFAVSYRAKGSEWRDGWVNKDYVVRNTLEIVLMESNVPAYIAPDKRAKKVGSLAKLTRHRVIGLYDDFYIINLRGAAAAFIPMDAAHYDTCFEAIYRQAPFFRGTANWKTSLRTGPGGGYPEADTLKKGEAFTCVDEVDGWVLVTGQDTGTDGGAYLFVSADDVYVDWNHAY